MDSNKTLEPRLVEVDNLGPATSDPPPYSLLWWLKKIVEALGGSAAGTPVDVQSTDWVAFDQTAWVDIVNYPLTLGDVFNLSQVTVSIEGFSARLEVLYFDGTSTTKVRGYVLNTQKPTFTEEFSQDKSLPYVGAGSYVKIRAKMNGVGQSGFGFGAINGFK